MVFRFNKLISLFLFDLYCQYWFICFKLNAIEFIDLDPEAKQTIPEPDPLHATYNKSCPARQQSSPVCVYIYQLNNF